MRASYMSINRVDVQQASGERGSTFHGRAKRGSVDHAQESGWIPCGSRQVRAGDLGTDVRQGTTRRHRQRLRRKCAYQEEHDVCSSLPWRQPVKTGSWMQSTRSLSVAESEFCSGVKGASILLGAKSMMIDFGEDVAQCVQGADSTSAKSIMETRGAERFRHLYCPVLWLRERVDSGETRIEKRNGEHNTADIGTKAVSAPVLMKQLKTLKMEWRD